MSDEVMESCGLGTIRYTIPFYLRFEEVIQEKVKELNELQKIRHEGNHFVMFLHLVSMIDTTHKCYDKQIDASGMHARFPKHCGQNTMRIYGEMLQNFQIYNSKASLGQH
jgi:hypothetical protein